MRNTAVRTLLLLWAFVVAQATEVKDGPKAAVFSCRGRSPGYYADLETGCQDYHMCDAGGRRYTYSCPNQTLFQQRVMICDHWFMVNCSLSEAHFGANLLIGQKDRQFVEHFQQASGHNEERSYPSRSRAFYAGTSSSSSSGDERTQPQGANEIKQALFGKHTSVQSATKKLPEEKESKTPSTNRYYSQFSTPTGSIKATTERSLPREFTNNPFFRGLTQASASLADKGDRGSLTFHGPRDVTSTSGTARTTASPLPPRRNATSSFSTPPIREVTPNSRNTPSFPNYQQRRTSTLVTTAVPLTYDYNFVTPEGHSNHLTQTETPKLRNNFSNVFPYYGDFTSKPSPSTQYESLKTRERTYVGASSPTPVTSAPHDLGVTPSPTLNATQGGNPQYGSDQYRPNVTQGSGGLQRTSGGFRFTTVNAAQDSNRTLASFSPLVPIFPKKPISSSRGIQSGIGAVPTNSGVVPSGIGSALTGSGSVPTGSGGLFTGSGLVLSSPGSTFDSSKDGLLTGPDAILPSAHGEDEDDYNTVEVRIPDPRRMFFIPDSAAREAEMLNSNNETVFKISVPSTRPHGAMRFKGVRGAEGRRADCPQCHPAFLLPGKCQPCVLIRR